MSLKLPLTGPRTYRIKDAYHDRVWRSPSAVWCREFLSWCLSALILAFLVDNNTIFAIGCVGAFLSVIALIAGSLVCNHRRVKIVQTGLCVKGIILDVKRLTFLHEFLRNEREKTFLLSYSFEDKDGREKNGSIWLCGCARKYFPKGLETDIVYPEQRPRYGFPLRLAVMYAPHK